jgi:hypothetical protein
MKITEELELNIRRNLNKDDANYVLFLLHATSIKQGLDNMILETLDKSADEFVNKFNELEDKEGKKVDEIIKILDKLSKEVKEAIK